MALGKRVQTAREKRKLKQAELAVLVFGSDDAKGQANISALETRDSLTSTHLFKFAHALQVRAEWLLDGSLPSGLEEDVPPRPARDKLLEQLIDLYGQLDRDRQDEVVGLANSLHAEQYPNASTSNPFGKSARLKGKRPARTKKAVAHHRR